MVCMNVANVNIVIGPILLTFVNIPGDIGRAFRIMNVALRLKKCAKIR